MRDATELYLSSNQPFALSVPDDGSKMCHACGGVIKRRCLSLAEVAQVEEFIVRLRVMVFCESCATKVGGCVKAIQYVNQDKEESHGRDACKPGFVLPRPDGERGEDGAQLGARIRADRPKPRAKKRVRAPAD